MSKDDFVERRCDDCGLIKLTQLGIEHVKKEMVDKDMKRLRNLQLTNDEVDAFGDDLGLVIGKLKILVCEDEIERLFDLLDISVTKRYHQIIRRKQSHGNRMK